MPSERDLDLIRASAAGDAERMRTLLGRGAKVNARMKNGATPLLAAAVAGRIEALQLLLLQGADLKARYRDEATVLIMAATQGHANVVQLLLQKGASHHERTRNGVTPLLAAAIEGHGAVVEALLAAGADPNAADARGVTPLIGAAVNGRMEALCALLAAGADIAAVSKSGLTALVAAVSATPAVAWVLLEKGADPNTLDEQGRPVLVAAAAGGKAEAMPMLLAKGARHGRCGYAGCRLGWTCRSRARRCLSAGRNPNAAGETGITPLIAAVVRGHTEMAELLIALRRRCQRAHQPRCHGVDGSGEQQSGRHLGCCSRTARRLTRPIKAASARCTPPPPWA